MDADTVPAVASAFFPAAVAAHGILPLWHACRFGVFCDVTHSYMWRDSFVCGTSLIHICVVTHSYFCVWRFGLFCDTWLIHMCDVTHLDVWRDSSVCVTWLIRIWARDVFVRVTWLIYTCVVTHSYG